MQRHGDERGNPDAGPEKQPESQPEPGNSQRIGGRNTGPRPMEMLLMGMGSCTAFDILNILDKARAEVTNCVAELDAERADEVPSVFTKIHVHFVVTGRGLKEKQVQRAVELSAEKYCSASIMLVKGGVEITHSYEIREA